MYGIVGRTTYACIYWYIVLYSEKYRGDWVPFGRGPLLQIAVKEVRLFTALNLHFLFLPFVLLWLNTLCLRPACRRGLFVEAVRRLCFNTTRPAYRFPMKSQVSHCIQFLGFGVGEVLISSPVALLLMICSRNVHILWWCTTNLIVYFWKVAIMRASKNILCTTSRNLSNQAICSMQVFKKVWCHSNILSFSAIRCVCGRIGSILYVCSRWITRKEVSRRRVIKEYFTESILYYAHFSQYSNGLTAYWCTPNWERNLMLLWHCWSWVIVERTQKFMVVN